MHLECQTLSIFKWIHNLYSSHGTKWCQTPINTCRIYFTLEDVNKIAWLFISSFIALLFYSVQADHANDFRGAYCNKCKMHEQASRLVFASPRGFLDQLLVNMADFAAHAGHWDYPIKRIYCTRSLSKEPCIHSSLFRECCYHANSSCRFFFFTHRQLSGFMLITSVMSIKIVFTGKSSLQQKK